ncbi:hypothetical protein [Azospirillum sp. B4]|uniref:hypothetical protein n=1 Tax=Azospirillum sp. B4 TaxID=95605 RepID=UPI00131F22CE|nr:hypothetical protein [Azospirillum sp. B4]
MASPAPVTMGQELGGSLADDSARLADGGVYDCYALNTKPRDQVTVTLHAAGFAGHLWLARGALCSAAAIQAEGQAGADGAALTFTAAGGRYLILAGSATGDARGAYTLTIAGQAATQVASAEDPADAAAARRALMDQQVTQFRADEAAAAAARQAAEEARQAELAARRAEEEAEDDDDDGLALFGALVGAAANAYADAAAQQRAESARLSALQAQAHAAEARRRADAQRDAQQQAARTAQQQQAGYSALARQLAEANAYRERQMATTTNEAERQRLAQQNAQALQAARQIGREAEVRQQTQAMMTGRPPQAEAPAQPHAPMAPVTPLPPTPKPGPQGPAPMVESRQAPPTLVPPQRVADARPAPEPVKPKEVAAAKPDPKPSVPAQRAPAPAIGTLTKDWFGWVAYGSHNGVEFYWRAKLDGGNGIRVQWRCVNTTSVRMTCGIGGGSSGDKVYRCYHGAGAESPGGAIGESSDVGPGRDYVFIGDASVCRDKTATFVVPDTGFAAGPAL